MQLKNRSRKLQQSGYHSQKNHDATPCSRAEAFVMSGNIHGFNSDVSDIARGHCMSVLHSTLS